MLNTNSETLGTMQTPKLSVLTAKNEQFEKIFDNQKRSSKWRKVKSLSSSSSSFSLSPLSSSSVDISTTVNLPFTKGVEQRNKLFWVQDNAFICSSSQAANSVDASITAELEVDINRCNLNSAATAVTSCDLESNSSIEVRVPVLLSPPDSNKAVNSKCIKGFKKKPNQQGQESLSSNSCKASAKRVALPFLGLFFFPAKTRTNSSNGKEVETVKGNHVLDDVSSNSNLVEAMRSPPSVSLRSGAAAVDSKQQLFFPAAGSVCPRLLSLHNTPSARAAAVQEPRFNGLQFSVSECDKTPTVINSNTGGNTSSSSCRSNSSSSCRSSSSSNHLNNSFPQRQVSCSSIASTHGTSAPSVSQNDEWMMTQNNLEEIRHPAEGHCDNCFTHQIELQDQPTATFTGSDETSKEGYRAAAAAAAAAVATPLSTEYSPYSMSCLAAAAQNFTSANATAGSAVKEPFLYSSIETGRDDSSSNRNFRSQQQQQHQLAFSNSSSLCHCPCRNCSVCPLKAVPQGKVKSDWSKTKSPSCWTRHNTVVDDVDGGNDCSSSNTDDGSGSDCSDSRGCCWWSRFRSAILKFSRMEAQQDLNKFKYDIHVIPDPPLPKGTQRLLQITELPFLILWIYLIYWCVIVGITAPYSPSTVWLSATVASVLVGIGLNANAYKSVTVPRRRGIIRHHRHARALQELKKYGETIEAVEMKIDWGMIIRFFMIPFGVSSLSGLTNSNRDKFLLVFPTDAPSLAVALLCPVFVICVFFVLRLLVLWRLKVRWSFQGLFLNEALVD